MIVFALILMFALVVASTWWFGLWSNLITLINLMLAAMVATSFYQNLLEWSLELLPTYAVLLPFLAIWLLFAISFFVLRGVTDTLSSMRLRFDFLTETIGRSLLSLLIAWVFICFALFTLQIAPLPPNLFGDTDLTKPVASATFGPDSAWAGFIRSRSYGSFAASREAGTFPADERKLLLPDGKPLELEARVFDPLNQFFLDAAASRRAISKTKTIRKTTSPRSEE